ncbi:putative aconitase X swivel domain, aconitase X catalytic domain-containing protein [Septoria linicola]|nr:putative aconitase X swivel domain, aconitase X catalytic domain-containing protein [Septoria linicola]
MHLQGRSLIAGTASGSILFSQTPLSFWGGTDSATGRIVDEHHPLCGESLKGKVLAIPCGRGSCSGSNAILEMMLNGNAPAALVFTEREEILTAGVIVAQVLFERSIPVLLLGKGDFAKLEHVSSATLESSILSFDGPSATNVTLPQISMQIRSVANFTSLELAAKDRDVLDGRSGSAAAMAMRIIFIFASVQGATELVDISQSHLDSVLYTGPATLMFAERLLALGGAKFAVPTTMNALSIDLQRWQQHNVDANFAEKANKLASAYVATGAKPTFTCAPYLLDTAPSAGEQVGWAESNAVVFANSVLGARTQKYPDLVDVCIALTGRAPLVGCHTDAGRLPSIAIQAPSPHTTGFDHDLFWPLLGYQVGDISGSQIPLVLGLEANQPSMADLKAFGAAFATTSSASMFHIRGVTPEHAILQQRMPRIDVAATDLQKCHRRLNSAADESVDVIALGNPHFSFEEFEALAALLQKYDPRHKDKESRIRLMVTTSRFTYDKITQCEIADALQHFGAELITDTCWCIIQESTIGNAGTDGTIMTNSAKYAHYGPGLVGRKIHFGSLRECVMTYFRGRREPV